MARKRDAGLWTAIRRLPTSEHGFDAGDGWWCRFRVPDLDADERWTREPQMEDIRGSFQAAANLGLWAAQESSEVHRSAETHVRLLHAAEEIESLARGVRRALQTMEGARQ